MPNISVKGLRAAALMLLLAVASIHGTNGAAAPLISATLNGTLDATLHPGQAGIFEVELAHPEMWKETLEPIRLEQGGGVSWTNALKSTVLNAGGATAAWPLWMRPVTSKIITLDGENAGRVFFLLSPQESSQIAPGVYSIEFVLDTELGAAAGAWAGTARSVQMDVRVEPAPAVLTAAQMARRQSQLAQYYILRGDPTAAVNAVDAMLATQPRSLEGLRTKAVISQMAGNFDDALRVMESAMDVFLQDHPNAPEPPRDLLLLRQELTELGTAAAAGVKITSVTAREGQLTIGWTGENGKQYGVQSSVDMKVWRLDATGLTALNAAANWNGGFDGSARFFRIIVE